MSKIRAPHKSTLSSQAYLFPEEGSQQGWDRRIFSTSSPPEPPNSSASHQYRWLMRAFTVARLTGGRRARSPRYLEIFSSSSSISGLGEIDRVRTLPAPSRSCQQYIK